MSRNFSEASDAREFFCPNIFVNGITKCKLNHPFSLDRIDVRRIACPFFLRRCCKYSDRCMYAHISEEESQIRSDRKESVMQQNPMQIAIQSYTMKCEFCGENLSRKFFKYHLEDCERMKEILQQSRDAICGICLDVIMDNEEDQNFGTLVNCNHPFCLNCIRQWRSQCKPKRRVTARALSNNNLIHESSEEEIQMDPLIAHSCPTCRTYSNLMMKSPYLLKTVEEKSKFVTHFLQNAKEINCLYFKKKGACKYGNKCVYLHANQYASMKLHKHFCIPKEIPKSIFQRIIENIFKFLM